MGRNVRIRLALIACTVLVASCGNDEEEAANEKKIAEQKEEITNLEIQVERARKKLKNAQQDDPGPKLEQVKKDLQISTERAEQLEEDLETLKEDHQRLKSEFELYRRKYQIDNS